jgi:glucokinase
MKNLIKDQTVNKGSAFLGIDIGGTNLRGALVGVKGGILSRYRQPCAIGDGRKAFLAQLADCIAGLKGAATSQGLKVKGIGIGVPGLISSDGMVVSSVNLRPIEGLNLCHTVTELAGLPVVCANDANLIAIGEHRLGAGQGFASLAVLTIGTGLGSGLILDNRLWTGAGGFAAEIGHLTVEPDGILCPCGNRGCLEQYVSASALVRHAGGGSPEELAILARNSDQRASAAFDTLGYYLGIAAAGLLNSLNLEAIVVGGGVSASFDLFAPKLQETINTRCFPAISQGVKLLPAALGDDAGLLGAALVAAAQSTD